MSRSAPDSDEHKCPAPGCTRDVPSSMLACRPHWFSLSKELRARVWAAWRSGDVVEHRLAVVDAMKALRVA